MINIQEYDFSSSDIVQAYNRCGSKNPTSPEEAAATLRAINCLQLQREKSVVQSLIDQVKEEERVL